MEVKRIIIHPSNVAARTASFTHEVEAMRKVEIKRLTKQLNELFKTFEAIHFRDLSVVQIQKLVDHHGLSVPSLLTDAIKKLRNLK
ncbi:hypothetical protein [Burkholderia catarinensis]|uniref:hypothetical protein n=1 Tax=Burkholderia catarinensis TaxID=1108140 RepID=UPI00091BA254|nr:hypothetical protein [Burkholderia catarinensis]